MKEEKTTELTIDFENCYGIRKLKKEFAFSKKYSTFSIYASNGTMKTSFAKIFENISKGEEPKDLVFPNRKTACKINFGEKPIDKNQIFVIRSYSQKYKSDKRSLLLVNKELRQEYENIYKKINEKKEDFLTAIKNICGEPKVENIEKYISKIFYNNVETKFFESLKRIEKELNFDKIEQYKDVKYKDIFEPKIKDFLNDASIRENIEEYIKMYSNLLNNSIYFKKGIFNHTQAEDTAKQLKKNGFFEAKHSVLFGGKTLSNEKELIEVIQKEKDAILENESLKKTFNKLDDQLVKNQGLKSFRDFLLNHQFIIAELANLPSFEAKL